MRVCEGYTYTLEFKNVETGEITRESVKDYDLTGKTPTTRAMIKAIELETEWIPYEGYFPNMVKYKREVRLNGYYY